MPKKIAHDFDEKKLAEVLIRGTRVTFYSRLQCSFNKLLHCRRMHKLLRVACLLLADATSSEELQIY